MFLGIIVRTLKNFKILRVIYRELYRRKQRLFLGLEPLVTLAQKAGFQVITRNDLVNHQSKYQLQEFASQKTVNISRSYTLEPIPEHLKRLIPATKLDFARPFICEFHDAQLVGNYAVGFNSRGAMILETTPPQFNPINSHVAQYLPLKSLMTKSMAAMSTPTIETACSLVTPWSRNYFHWFTDFLTQLEAVEYYQQEIGVEVKLVVEPLNKWQKSSLEMLGFHPQNCFIWKQSTRYLKVKKLLVPGYRRNYASHRYESISPDACRWVKNRILSYLDLNVDDIKKNNKIYISRGDALARKVINEAEVIAALKPKGFMAYELEKMTFVEQVKLFHQAEIVIAPHGAGITNIIFAQQPIIIELFGSFVARTYANLARGLGCKYGCLSFPAAENQLRWEDSDLFVNIPQLLNLLEQMQKDSTIV